MTWSPTDIPDLSSKTILVTGANSGVGFYATRYFVQHNAHVIMACRNPTKMADAAASIVQEHPTARITQLQLDISDLQSVHSFADQFKQSGIQSIDVLLLNAGVVLTTFQKSKQGFENMFATNHLGHWLLVGLLLDYIKSVPGSRIVAVSSIAHLQTSAIDYNVVTAESVQKFNHLEAYAQSKLANQLFVKQLQKYLEEIGAQTVAVAAHPGASSTNMTNTFDERTPFLWRVMWYFLQTAEKGSWPLVYASTDRGVKKEFYYGPSGWLEIRGVPKNNAKLSKVVNDWNKARELWEVSERLTGFRYKF